MKLDRLKPVGVATPSLDRAIAFWRETMAAGMIGFRLARRAQMIEQYSWINETSGPWRWRRRRT